MAWVFLSFWTPVISLLGVFFLGPPEMSQRSEPLQGRKAMRIHPRIRKASETSQQTSEADIKAHCESLDIEYIGDQPDHPIYNEGYSITFTPRSTQSRSATPKSEASPTKPEPTVQPTSSKTQTSAPDGADAAVET